MLLSNLALVLLFWQWPPVGAVTRDLSGTPFVYVLWGLSAIGWVSVLISTFLLDRLELSGLG